MEKPRFVLVDTLTGKTYRYSSQSFQWIPLVREQPKDGAYFEEIKHDTEAVAADNTLSGV